MTETMTQHRPPKRAKRDRARMADDVVTPNSLATHLGRSGQNIARLTAEAIIEQRSDGNYDQTASRLRYIRHLRTARPHSPRTQADAEHTAVKTEFLKLRLMEKRVQLFLQSDVDDLIHKIVGVTLTGLSGLAARCAPPGDLVTRRNIERAVFELRKELAAIGERMADEAEEPPLQDGKS
jgi:hypothetical protein